MKSKSIKSMAMAWTGALAIAFGAALVLSPTAYAQPGTFLTGTLILRPAPKHLARR